MSKNSSHQSVIIDEIVQTSLEHHLNTNLENQICELEEEIYNNEGHSEFNLEPIEGPPVEEPELLDHIATEFERDSGLPRGIAEDAARRSVYCVGMAEIARYSKQGYNILAKKVEEMGPEFFRYILGEDSNTSRRFLSDVFIFHYHRDIGEIVAILQQYGTSRINGFFGFSVEEQEGHIHIIHDCAFHSGSCRDVFRQRLVPYGNFKARRFSSKPLIDFQRYEWYDVFIYYFVAKRGTREIYVRGESGKIPDHAESIRWTEECGPWSKLVRRKDIWNNYDNRRKRPNSSNALEAFDQGAKRALQEEKRGTSARKYTTIKEKTKTLLNKYFVSPPYAIQNICEFRNNDLLSDPKNKDYVSKAIQDWCIDLIHYQLKDFKVLMDEFHETIQFNTDFQYMSREESVDVISQLLKYQFQDDSDNIYKFLSSVVDVIDKRVPKLNSLAILSPPSAGKNFFFDMITSIIINYGQLGQANKNNLFAFQEAPNKRLLIWNEPNYEPGMIDTIKMMLGGDPYTVRVKNQLDQHVKRTPVFIMSNTNVSLFYDTAFKDRLRVFHWQHAEFLKDFDTKPYPLAFFDILKKYNVHY